MAKAGIKVTGLKQAQAKLTLAMGGIKNGSRAGVRAAAVFVKGEAQNLTSIDTSVLINSAFNKDVSTRNESAQVVGYTAEYAKRVHEKPDDTNWQRPGAENKFLEKAVVRNLTSILNLITRYTKL